jgi:hypothetical protein
MRAIVVGAGSNTPTLRTAASMQCMTGRGMEVPWEIVSISPSPRELHGQVGLGRRIGQRATRGQLVGGLGQHDLPLDRAVRVVLERAFLPARRDQEVTVGHRRVDRGLEVAIGRTDPHADGGPQRSAVEAVLLPGEPQPATPRAALEPARVEPEPDVGRDPVEEVPRPLGVPPGIPRQASPPRLGTGHAVCARLGDDDRRDRGRRHRQLHRRPAPRGVRRRRVLGGGVARGGRIGGGPRWCGSIAAHVPDDRSGQGHEQPRADEARPHRDRHSPDAGPAWLDGRVRAGGFATRLPS